MYISPSLPKAVLSIAANRGIHMVKSIQKVDVVKVALLCALDGSCFFPPCSHEVLNNLLGIDFFPRAVDVSLQRQLLHCSLLGLTVQPEGTSWSPKKMQ